MGVQAHELDVMPLNPRSTRLARLVLVPGPPTPFERLQEALGPELARFLVNALADGQGRRGSSSP
jgi:hypothetical protein